MSYGAGSEKCQHNPEKPGDQPHRPGHNEGVRRVLILAPLLLFLSATGAASGSDAQRRVFGQVRAVAPGMDHFDLWAELEWSPRLRTVSEPLRIAVDDDTSFVPATARAFLDDGEFVEALIDSDDTDGWYAVEVSRVDID